MSIGYSSINFNKVLDILFNETTIPYNEFNSYFNNDDSLKYFFISVIREFTPEESITIFNNKTAGNSRLSILFTENLQSLLNHEKLITLPSFDIILEKVIELYINQNEIMELVYSIANFIVEKKTNQFPSIYTTSIKKLLFYPQNSFLLEKSLFLIENTTIRMFKTYEARQYTLSNIFTYDFISEILNEKNINKSTKICILYYAYNITFQFNNFKDRLTKNNMIKIDNNSLLFSPLSVFQQNFYSNFSFLELYNELMTHNNSVNMKLENMLIDLSATIQQFFCDYELSNLSTLDTNIIIDIALTTLLANKNEICVKDWITLFYINPYKVAILTVKKLTETKEDEFNYYDLIEIYYILISKYKNEKTFNDILLIFIKCVIIIYIMFNSDMKNYSFLFQNETSNEEEVQSYITQFNTNIIILMYKIKSENVAIYPKAKQNILNLLNDLVFYHDYSLFNLIANNELFNEKLIQFIINEVEASHISSKFFDYFIQNSKEPHRILNGFLLICHWANKYPLKFIYTKLLDVLFIFRKTIDLRTILINEENISKFIKGLFLLFKAFPHLDEDFIAFIKYLKNSVSNLINDYSLANYAKEQIEKLMKFTSRKLKNSNYRNTNTFFIQFNNI